MLQNDPLRLPTFPFDADPDPAFHFDANPDPAFQFNADPDPQHCNGNHKGRVIVYGRICLHAENNVTQLKGWRSHYHIILTRKADLRFFISTKVYEFGSAWSKSLQIIFECLISGALKIPVLRIRVV